MAYGSTELNPGTGGDSIAHDAISGVKFQRVKLAHGAEGAATDASATSPLPVRSVVEVFDLTFALDTLAYADGDVLMSSTQSIANFFADTTDGRMLYSIHVLDESDQGMGFDLIFFDSNVSLGTVNAAPNISDTDARSIIGRVSISGTEFYDLGGCRIATRTGINLPLLANGSTTLYVSAISRGTGTYAASGIRVKLGTV
jgi:hypothetical protein